MTTTEAVAAKRDMDAEIARLIVAFQDKTGLAVNGISIRHFAYTMGKPTSTVIQVESDVRL